MPDSAPPEDTREPLCVSIPEAARLLGIGRKLAYHQVNIGRIPSVQFGRRRVVPVAALESLLVAP